MHQRDADHEAEIERDGWGIPHVRARTAIDVAYGQGLATAQDRAWQLCYDGWRAEGRLAEHVGSGGLDWDVFARRAVIADTARRSFAGLRAETKAFVAAYVAGVNDGLPTAEAPELDALGLDEPSARPRWPDWMPLGVFIVQHILFSTFPTKLWRAHLADRLGVEAVDLLRLDGHLPSPAIVGGVDLEPVPIDGEALGAVLSELGSDWLSAEEGLGLSGLGGGPMLSGSNSFAVGGARTASGFPMIGGDPHRLHDLPNVYHQMHLVCEEFDVLGLAFVGVPGIPHFAHAGAVAWGITNAMADYQDLYVERLDRRSGTVRSRTADGWDRVDVATHTLLVRDAAPVVLETLRTRHGPVVLPLTEQLAVSLRTPALETGDLGFDALLPLLRSRTVGDVEDAFAGWVEPVNNMLAADVSGAVRYRTAGKIPVRPVANQWLPVPGWHDAYAWQGLLPDADLPRWTVPADGSVATANQRISENSARVGVEYADPARAGRIGQLLAGRSGLTVEDLAAVHADVLLTTVPDLQQAVGRLTGMGAAEEHVARRIREFDARMSADSADARCYSALRSALVERLVSDPVFVELIDRRELPGFWDRWMSVAVRVHAGLRTLLERSADRPLGLQVEAALRGALADVAETETGTETLTWGAHHRYHPAHGLALQGVLDLMPDLASRLTVRPVPLAGDSSCVQANHSVPGVSDLSVMGPVARYVWDLADRDASRWIVPLGASGIPGHPHFDDQLDVWAAGGSLPVAGDQFSSGAPSRTG